MASVCPGGAGLSWAKGSVLRTSLVALSGFMVLLIPDFAAIMGLIGSTCCMLLGLIMPGLIHLRLFENNLSTLASILDYGIVALGVTGSVIGTNDALTRIFGGGGGDA